MSLSTGDNAPLHRGILVEMAQVAMKVYGCHLIGPYGDDGGRYAFKMTTPQGDPFILVAKGSRRWAPDRETGAILSVQYRLLLTAMREGLPLVLAYRDPERMGASWYGIDPAFVLQYGLGGNERSPRPVIPQLTMWNFQFRLVTHLSRPQNVMEAFKW